MTRLSLSLTLPIRRVSSRARDRFAWDDEIPDWGYKSRTTSPSWEGENHPPNPPAVLRFYPSREESGDYRVNLEKDSSWGWEETIILLNNSDGDGLQRFEYWSDDSTAQFNTTGWPRMAYLGMCGNEVEVIERVPGWVRFKTLRPTDWLRARSMSFAKNPTLIHKFSCVTWVKDPTRPGGGFTRHIESTGTPRGQVYYPLVTWEGSAWIPARYIVKV